VIDFVGAATEAAKVKRLMSHALIMQVGKEKDGN
jgi:hypothetical protein